MTLKQFNTAQYVLNAELEKSKQEVIAETKAEISKIIEEDSFDEYIEL